MFPEALGPIAALSDFALYFFLIALAFAYTNTLGALLRKLVELFNNYSISILGASIGLSVFAGPLTDVDNFIRGAIGTGINATGYSAKRWLAWTAHAFYAIGAAERYAATETLRGFTHLRRVIIPALIGAAVGPLSVIAGQELSHSNGVSKTVTRAVTNIYRVTKVYPRTIVQEIPRVARAVTHAPAVAAAVAGTLVFPRIGQIQRDLSGVRANIAKLAKYATVAGAVGLVASSLARLGMGSSRCSNNQRFQKGLCGLNPKWIEDLLLGAVSIFGTLSLVKLAEDYQGLIKDVQGEVVHFWRADVAGAGRDRALGQTGL